jgi:penicillin amidase
LRFFKAFLIVAAVILAAAAGTIWWTVYRPLPRVDGTSSLPGLKQQVTVDRDAWGVPHIRAASLRDLAEAQGYVMAQDRLWQMDLLRRVAAGELSEIFGSQALPVDKRYRALGLRVAAERDVATLDPEAREILDAYAQGVNRFLDENKERLPLEFTLLRYSPRPWKSSDSLLISGYMYETLTTSWRSELNRAKVTALVGEERARELYVEESDLDHFVVGGTNSDNKTRARKKEADEEDDELPADEVVKTRHRIPRHPPSGDGMRAAAAQISETASQQDSADASSLWTDAQSLFGQSEDEVRAAVGSNNWVVSGAHTASGKPLLANDTHLELGVPDIWYLAHLTAPGYDVEGFALPGGPLIIIGHNDRIAWGFTNNGADVQDLYIETFSPDHPDEYRVNGQWKKAEVRHEAIRVKGRPDEAFDVVVTRHGPVVAREGGNAYALKWTALQPGGLANTYQWMGRARNWEEFRDVMKRVWGPAQNAVYADVDGNIGYVVGARVPIRKKGNGKLPVPGDTDDYEWTGYIPFDDMPQVLNPPVGIIATANARVVGPEYKPYLTDRWASPYRTDRIYELLERNNRLRPADYLKIQTDIYSRPDRELAEHLVRAGKSVPPSDPRAKEMLAKLDGWDGQARAEGPETSFVEVVRTKLLQHLLEPFLGAQTSLYSWFRQTAFLENALRQRPARWLPANYKSYDDLLIACADDAARALTKETHKDAIPAWDWGNLNRLQMVHPLGRSGILRMVLSNAGGPQAGTVYSPRAASATHGPAMRLIADLSDWDASIMMVTTGESGQLGSAHFRDQYPIWFEGRELPAAFSNGAEQSAHRHRLVLEPAP